MIQLINNKEFLEIIYNDFNNNRLRNLNIYLEDDDLVNYFYNGNELVFSRRMTNKNILGILTEVLWNDNSNFQAVNVTITYSVDNKYGNLEITLKEK